MERLEEVETGLRGMISQEDAFFGGRGEGFIPACSSLLTHSR